jgi:hypothetical protein
LTRMTASRPSSRLTTVSHEMFCQRRNEGQSPLIEIGAGSCSVTGSSALGYAWRTVGRASLTMSLAL